MLALLFAAVQAAAPASRVTLEPARVEVGQPAVLTLTVERDAQLAVELPALEPGVAGSWAVLDALPVERETRGGRVVERAAWRVFALEGGAELPALEVAWKEGDAGARALVERAPVEVAHALAEGEDSARPPSGFRAPVEWTGGTPRLAWIGAALLALGIALLVLRRVRKRSRRAAPAVLAPLERLALLETQLRAPHADARAGLYELTRLVRDAADERAGKPRASKSDAEWVAALGAGELGSARASAERLLAHAERWKYGGEEPSRFAVDEALTDARAVLAALLPPAESGTRRAA